MISEINLIEGWQKNSDSPFKFYVVQVNGGDISKPFTHLPDAKAAAFDECLKAAINGPITVSYVSL